MDQPSGKSPSQKRYPEELKAVRCAWCTSSSVRTPATTR
jgi:hypothetical protein